ncbi:MAG: flagellar basal body-associated FliL family protein, partial [Paracoccaceae bacterium]
FKAQVEVPVEAVSDVEKLKPRITDVLNSYLRAIEASNLDDALALTRLRSQMLRRINIVTGQGRVHDLLIMEFVLN